MVRRRDPDHALQHARVPPGLARTRLEGGQDAVAEALGRDSDRADPVGEPPGVPRQHGAVGSADERDRRRWLRVEREEGREVRPVVTEVPILLPAAADELHPFDAALHALAGRRPAARRVQLVHRLPGPDRQRDSARVEQRQRRQIERDVDRLAAEADRCDHLRADDDAVSRLEVRARARRSRSG